MLQDSVLLGECRLMTNDIVEMAGGFAITWNPGALISMMALVGLAILGSSTSFAATLCVRLTATYTDAGVGTFWTEGTTGREATRMSGQIKSSNGSTLWGPKFLDQHGCADLGSTAVSGQTFNITLRSQASFEDNTNLFVYLGGGSSAATYSAACKASASGACVMPEPSVSSTRAAFAAALVAAFAQQKMGGWSGSDAIIRVGGSECRTDQPTAVVSLSYGCAKRKFIIAHEYGHLANHKGTDAASGPHKWTGGMDNYSAPAVTPLCNQANDPMSTHSLTSVEYQFKAHIEGLAHAYAAKVWGDHGDFRYYKTVMTATGTTISNPTVSLTNPSASWPAKWLKTVCVQDKKSGRGVELDWARTWYSVLNAGGMAGVNELIRSSGTWTLTSVRRPIAAVASAAASTFRAAALLNGIDTD